MLKKVLGKTVIGRLYSDIVSRLGEIASFANEAKNGRSYHAGGDVVMTTIYTGQIIAVDRRDISLAPHLILRGVWEESLSRKSEEVVSRCNSAVIFDVGANFGWYGLILSRFSKDSVIHFFEANPGISELIKRTALVNGLPLRSVVTNCAVGSRSGEFLELSVPKMHKGSASVVGFNQSLERFHENMEDIETCKVPTLSLDDYCKSHAIESIDFMKIDVEGAEGEVLLGARAIIKSSPGLVIMMEWNKKRYSDCVLDVINEFRRCEGLDESGCFVDLSRALLSSSSIASFEEKAAFALGRSDATWLDLFFYKS